VRVLFTYAGGSGHADPMVPIAEAVAAAGHTAAFAGERSGAGVVEAQGFTLLGPPAEAVAASSTIAPLRALDMEHEYEVLRDHYAGREARNRAASILELSSRWLPDLIVCDEVDFGSMVAAEQLGVPHVTVLVTASGSFVRPDVVTGSLDVLRAEHGLPPDPDLMMPRRHLVVSPFPPSFRDPAFPLPPTAHSIRAGAMAPENGDTATSWRPPSSGRPVVYFTLGTVFNTESGDLFQRVLTGLQEPTVEVVVTVGRDVDPASFGPQPPHVHIARYIPQSALLPRCDLVVNHGGSGSVIGALAHGRPMVVIPMGADQASNAARCEQLGVGVALDAVETTPRSVRETVGDVLHTPSYRVAAERIRDEVSALPGPETVVPLLEDLGSA
jgi:UDP:flavonoid glycosyltransferase YjiC (YdhE family)